MKVEVETQPHSMATLRIELPPGSDRAARGQACLRFCAWVFVLAGLANAAIWAFAPLRQAALWSMVPIIAAFLLVGARILQAKRKAI